MGIFFLTGVSGEVGRRLALHLLEQDHEVWGMARGDSLIRHEKYHSVQASVSDWQSVESLPSSVDTLIHLAWAGAGGPERADTALQARNVMMSLAAVELASHVRATRFVGVGTITEVEVPFFLARGENESPGYVYGSAKREAAERTRQACEAHGITHVWARLGNSYASPIRGQARFLTMILEKLSRDEPISLSGGAQPYDFVSMKDVVRAFELIGLMGQAGETYYIGEGAPRPLSSFVRELALMMRSNSELTFGDPGPSPAVEDYSIDNLTRDTGFVPTVPFSEGALDLVAEFED